MGRDKALLELGGKKLVEIAVDSLSAVAETVKIVGLRSEYAGKSELIPDASDGRGAVIGLYTALADCETEYAAVLACDLPFADAGLLRSLVDSIGDQDAAMPMQQDGRSQPLCALYRVVACLPVIEAIVASDNWRLQQLSDLLRVSFTKPSDTRWSINVNTPAELQSAVKIADNG